MHLLDVARGQRPLTLYESENALYGGVVILDHGGNRLRMLAISVRDERRIYAPLDQQLRNSAVERVQALDPTSLDGPLAVQSLVESYERILRLQPFTLFLPHRGQMFQLRLCEILRVRLMSLVFAMRVGRVRRNCRPPVVPAGAALLVGIGGGAQAVAEEVERQHGNHVSGIHR